MKRDFDKVKISNSVSRSWTTTDARRLWIPQSLIGWCPWTAFPRNRQLVKARLNEIVGVAGVEDHLNYEGELDGYNLFLESEVPDALVKMRFLKTIDFWGMFPDAWDGGRLSIFEAWADEVEKCVS